MHFDSESFCNTSNCLLWNIRFMLLVIDGADESGAVFHEIVGTHPISGNCFEFHRATHPIASIRLITQL